MSLGSVRRGLLPSVLLVLACACSAPAVWEETDAQGTEVRHDSNELAAEAVTEAEVRTRLADYEKRELALQPVAEVPAPTAAGETDPSNTNVELPAAREEDAEPGADLAEVKKRLDAYLGLPEGSRMITADGELLESAAPDTPAFDPFKERGCPPEGSAKSAKTKKLNKLKNRTRRPHAADFDDEATFAALRDPGDTNTEPWLTSSAATIECYVSKVFASGDETCNCGATKTALTDTHFDLLAGPNDTGRKVIAEVTPIWRLMHEHFHQEDWSTAALKKKYEGKRVRITGWLFFDEMHIHEADNTDPNDSKGKKNWRATAWEIHPITKIEIVQ